MKQVKYWLFLVVILLISPTKTSAVINDNVGPGKEYEYLRNATNINTINPQEGTVEVDGKYNFSLQLINQTNDFMGNGRYNKGTEYIVKGNFRTENFSSSNTKVKESKVFVFEKSDKEQYVYIRQAGFYMGKSVDIKLSIDTSKIHDRSLFRVIAPKYSERTYEATGVIKNNDPGSYENLGEAFLYLGSTLSGIHSYGKIAGLGPSSAFYFNSLKPEESDKINYTYSFYETDLSIDELTDENIKNKKPIKINGLWNIDNANYVKTITDLNNFNDLTKYFIYKTPNDTVASPKYDILKNSNNVVFKKNIDNQLEFTGNDAASSDLIYPGYIYGKLSTSLTTLFENKDSLSYSLLNNYQLANKKPVESGYSSLGIKYSRSAIPRVAPTDPYVIGIKNASTHTSTDYTDLQYDIRFGVGSNDEGKRNDALSVQTEVPAYYDIIKDKIEIVNMVNDDKLILGTDYTIEIDPINSSKVKIIFTNPTSSKINDGYFRISINAETNSKFEFSPDKYGYLNDSTSEDNGYMHFDLAKNTTLTYTHNASNNVDKVLTSKKIDERSIAKVNYEGIPLGEAKDGLTLLQGNSISDEYPDVTSLLQDGFDTLVDTNNISRDTPVKATFIGELPETKNLAAGTVVDVPIRLTTPLGVTKDIVAKLTIRSNKSLLNVEFRNEADELLSSVQKEFPVNTEVDLTKIPEVVNELDKYIANGEYSIVEKPTEEKFILTNANGTQVYKLIGNLIIASAPELFDFGSHEKKFNDIEQKQAINLDTQKPLTIKDRRADKSNGWTLQLKSITEFNSGGEELTGAMIYRLNATDTFTVSSSAEKAYEKADGGDYNLTNDWSENGAGLGINIDIKKIKKLGTYQAELEWELIAGTGP